MATEATVSPARGRAVLWTQGGAGPPAGSDGIDLRRMMEGATGWQEGVFDADGWRVTADGGGASMDLQVAADVGLARIGAHVVAPHRDTITLTATAADPTHPRVDLMVLRVHDDAPWDGVAQVEILAGTPAPGASLDTLDGQAGLPDGAIRLADVLVPAQATTIGAGEIRDRRPWAKGASLRIRRTAGAAGDDDYTSGPAPMRLFDATNLYPRVECSGALVQARLIASHARNSGGATGDIVRLTCLVDGVETDGERHIGYSRAGVGSGAVPFEWTFSPAAGPRRIGPAVAVDSSSALTWLFFARGTVPFIWEVRELRPPSGPDE